MTKKRGAPTRLTAAQLAKQEVEALFTAMIEDAETFYVSCSSRELERFERAFEKVSDQLAAEVGKPSDDDTSNVATELHGIRAGYLIGVQVGLRLRGAR